MRKNKEAIDALILDKPTDEEEKKKEMQKRKGKGKANTNKRFPSKNPKD